MRKGIDICLLVSMMVLMCMPVISNKVHEWLGIAMIILMLVHQLLNRRWYQTLTKGTYTAYRKLLLAVNALLLLTCLLTAFSGMGMSYYATPFLRGSMSLSGAQTAHLACSYYFFLLAGLHLGMNSRAVLPLNRLTVKMRQILTILAVCFAGYGCYLFYQSGIVHYLTFQMHMPFMDFTKTDAEIFLENMFILFFWSFLGAQLPRLCRRKRKS